MSGLKSISARHLRWLDDWSIRILTIVTYDVLVKAMANENPDDEHEDLNDDDEGNSDDCGYGRVLNCEKCKTRCKGCKNDILDFPSGYRNDCRSGCGRRCQRFLRALSMLLI